MIKKSLTKKTTAAACVLLFSLAMSPKSFAAEAPDLDGDGIPNIVDTDIDNDGVPNALDDNVDGGICKKPPYVGKYIGDHINNDSVAEKDIDGDRMSDDSLAENDIDGDGSKDDSTLEKDIDGDRRLDDSANEKNTDGDDDADDSSTEDDIDGDSLSDDDDSEMNIDGDDKGDDVDDDIDGDDKGNSSSADDDTDGDGRLNASATEDNDDGDSRRDRDDDDDDNDGDDDSDDADHHQEDDELEVQISLTKTANAPGGSRCRVKIQRMATGKLELELDGRDFAAGAYDVVVDGTSIGQFNMILNGGRVEGEQEWETNANKPSEINLTIDVIGKPIAVMQNGVTYFSGTVPTPPSPGDVTPPPTTPTSATLVAGPAAPAQAHGSLDVEWGVTGAKELEVEIEDIPAGAYSLIIGGELRGTITVTVSGQGNVKFDVSPKAEEGELPLDFVIAGLPVVVSQGESVFFTGTVPTAPGDGNGAGDGTVDDNGAGTPVVTALSRTTSAPVGANGEVQVQFGPAGVVGLEVEAEDLPDGSYDLAVGGVLRGTMTVTAGRGKVRYEVVPDAAGELLLDFAVAGQTVTLSQGEIVLLSGTAAAAPSI